MGQDPDEDSPVVGHLCFFKSADASHMVEAGRMPVDVAASADGLVFGRDHDVDVRIRIATVSRRAVVLRRTADGAKVCGGARSFNGVDLKSKEKPLRSRVAGQDHQHQSR